MTVTEEQRKAKHRLYNKQYYQTHQEYRKKCKLNHQKWLEQNEGYRKKYNTEYYQLNREEIDKQHAEYKKIHGDPNAKFRVHKYEQKRKIQALSHYSNGKLVCVECSEPIFEFLTIHHVYGRKAVNHNRRMTGGTLYRWLVLNKFPEGYKTLCYNCNCKKEFAQEAQKPEKYKNKDQKHYYETFLDRAKRIKLEGINHYTKGAMKCDCCGINDIEYLTIEHKNGKKHTKHNPKIGGLKLWIWLKNNNYPKDFEVLCYNCNSAKGFYGQCPHQAKSLILNNVTSSYKA